MAVFKLRVFNLLYFGIYSMFISYLPVYLASRNLSETTVGAILGAGGIVSILSQPLWGFVCDNRSTISNVLKWLLVVSAAIGTALFFTNTVYFLLALTVLMYFLFVPTDSMVESLNYQTAHRNGIGYGSIKMFGALGYAAASLLMGSLIHRYGMPVLAYGFLVYGLAAVAVGSRVEDVRTSHSPLSGASLRLFLSNRKTLWFFSVVFIMALPHRMNDTFIGLYLQSKGGSVQDVGYAWFMMTLAEVGCFAIVHKFVKPGSELRWIAAAGALYSVRFALTSMSNPLFVVLLQLMQGVTFVVFFAAAIQYLYVIVPESWKVTGQTLLGVVFFGISGVVGSFLGGLAMRVWGGETMYLGMAFVSAVATGLCVHLARRRFD